MADEVEQLEQELVALKKRLVEARKRCGGRQIEADYAFRAPDGRTLRLADLFGEKHDLLVLHNMGESCTYCMLWADGFGGFADRGHLQDRAAFWLVNNDPADQLGRYAMGRRWGFPVASCRGTQFSGDMGLGDGRKDGSPP